MRYDFRHISSDFAAIPLNMKIVSDADVHDYLNKSLSRDSILNYYQPTLLKSLQDYRENNEIVPPRTVREASTKGSDVTHLFMPCVAPNATGAKIISGGPSNSRKGLGFQGLITIVDEFDGTLTGIVNAKTITPFRTALASTIGLVKAIDPLDVPEGMSSSMCVFGVGPQAYWHIKLTLILFPNIREVSVVNRSHDKAVSFAETLQKDFGDKIKLNVLLYEDKLKAEELKHRVSESSIVYGCIPSTSPSIDFESLNKDESVPVFVSLIGSYKPSMRELDISALKSTGVKLVVDTANGVEEEAGEVADAGLKTSQMVELAQLLTTDKGVYTLLQNIVIQKLVGMSIMDIVVAKMLVKDTGTVFEGF